VERVVPLFDHVEQDARDCVPLSLIV